MSQVESLLLTAQINCTDYFCTHYLARHTIDDSVWGVPAQLADSRDNWLAIVHPFRNGNIHYAFSLDSYLQL